MAYVVRRANGSWELRESLTTPRGPRSHTLTSFRRFRPGVVARAVRAAKRPITPDEVYATLEHAGAVSSGADEAARALLAEAGAGRLPSPGLRRLVLGALGDPNEHDLPGQGAGEWLTATEADRGETIRDLMRSTDRLPLPPPQPLAFPPLTRAAGDA